MPKKLSFMPIVTCMLIFSSYMVHTDDDLDNKLLSNVLKTKKFSPTYAQNKLSFGRIQEESYMTEDSSLAVHKTFLKEQNSAEFRYWKNYYLKQNATNATSLLNKGAPYKQIVENILLYHNLPRELYYLGLIESRYEKRIKSPVGALGPWQFLAATGREYGLIIDRYYDERTNLIKSTHAAAEYFKDLYNIFGSWELALSAYNSGEYGVIRKMRQAGTRDFYELSRRKVLPPETRNYIPKILAIMHIDKNKAQYGVKVKKPIFPLGHYENTYLVELKTQRKLKEIASEIGIDITQIRSLNPELRGYYTPKLKNKQTYSLRLPRTKNERVIASAPVQALKVSKKILPDHHIVKHGENLSTIANLYDMPLAQIFIINEGLEKRTLHPGDKVSLKQKTQTTITQKKPADSIATFIKETKDHSPQKLEQVSQPATHHEFHYKIKKGDSLYSISMLFNVKIAYIKAKNHMSSNALKVGETIKIPGVSRTIHIVKKGEYLSTIAHQYKNTVEAIKHLNNLKTPALKAGQAIVVIN